MILAGISLSFVLGDNGILKKAQETADAYKNASQSEQQTLQNIEDYLYGEKGGNNTGDNTTGSEGATWTSFTTAQSAIGYYGDLDGDGKPEGVIYADLAFGGNGTWGTTDGTYGYDREDGDMFRPYWISPNVYDGPFGKKEIVTPKDPNSDGGVTTGEFRFYMMALNDIDENEYEWYDKAYSGISNTAVVTSTDFGTGKTNTTTMMEKWENKEFGNKNTGSSPDLWGQIKTQVANGWFVPSRDEWSAFADALGVSADRSSPKYYENLKLSMHYWSSSQQGARNAWNANLDVGYMECMSDVNWNRNVRLSIFF